MALAMIDFRTELSSSTIELFEFARECDGGGIMSESVNCFMSELDEVVEPCGEGRPPNLNERLRWPSEGLDCTDE